MGTEFFWFYDVILAGILIGIVFLGVKRGFVRMLLSLLSVAIAFVAALVLSGYISTWIYDSFVEESLTTTITDTVNDAIGDNVLTELSKVDMDKAEIDKLPVSTFDVKPDKAGKITLDLSTLDVSKTGLDKVDLSIFGLPKGADISELKLGTVQINGSEISEHGLADMILAKILCENIMNSPIATTISDVIDEINKAVPILNLDDEALEQTDNSLVTDIVIALINSAGNPGQSIVDNIIKPVILIPIRTIVFIILFVAASILLSVVIKATSLINKIPLIGSFNEFLGGALGFVEGVVIVFVVAILLRMAVSLSDNTLIFLNDMTIEKSFIFSYVYDFKFLDFLNIAK